MSADAFKSEVAAKLPAQYEPLLLTFYGLESQVNRGMLVIGDDYGTELCLDLSSGNIQSIDPNSEHPTRFMNSSIAQLAQFIATHDRLVSKLTVDADTDLSSQLELLRSSLLATDQVALARPENWWSTVLEQLEYEI
ncbi:SUKH-4 family immunity protein [Anatilimnocola floriformis]|uniref:SUKH-4 family immunity protein n=1 Tax=Anatilimnocola floriformis TaxID=2948575 RepID=UPI0020C2D4FC|nr:SUKH-4 family immunity protein [Anatilimnocola floriformis]